MTSISQSNHVTVSSDGDGLKTITLDCPAVSNALSAPLVECVLATVKTSYEDGTQTLVFTSSGRHFCSGFDLSGIEDQRDSDLLARFIRIELLLQAVYMAPFDTVACAKGAAYGAGADLFAACRWRIAHPDAYFAMPGLQFGVALGTGRLGRLIGEAKAYELLRSGARYNARDALEIGLVEAIQVEDLWIPTINRRHKSRRVHGNALADLARLTRRDYCARDMFALVESASKPGLGNRLRAYRDRMNS